MHFKGRNVVVLGLGLTGLSLARWLTRHGARVRVADTRDAPPNAQALAADLPNVTLETGPFSSSTFTGVDLIAISPGVAKDQPAIAQAVAQGVELVGDIELFARALPRDQRVPAFNEGRVVAHLSFNVDKPNNTNMMVIIQNRTTTCVSFHPPSS